MKHSKYCKNIEEIENYASAAADNFIGWDIHHRLETHNSDGERRSIDLSRAELIALGTYYDRPASELIFIKHGDHMRLHKNGKPMSEEARAKMSAAAKNRSEEWRAKIAAAAKNRSEEWRAKMSAASRGRHFSDETRAKLREAWKHRAPMSAETRAKQSAAQRGKHLSDETRAKMSYAAKHRCAKTSA